MSTQSCNIGGGSVERTDIAVLSCDTNTLSDNGFPYSLTLHRNYNLDNNRMFNFIYSIVSNISYINVLLIEMSNSKRLKLLVVGAASGQLLIFQRHSAASAADCSKRRAVK